MPSTTIIITDLVSRDRLTLLVGGDRFEALVRQHWEREDTLLSEMQSNWYFAGRTRWCDLDPKHYRLMITSNLNKVASLTDEERASCEHPFMASLLFLLAALLNCLQVRSECRIETMRIHRYAATEALFDYTAILDMHLSAPTPLPPEVKQGEFRVVVDNE